MPHKAEYWSLTRDQFKDIKAEMTELGEKVLSHLKENGFTKITSSNDWLGVTIENKQTDLVTLVGFSLNRESPLEFQLVLRKWDIRRLPQSFAELYEAKFETIEKFQSSFGMEMKKIKELLR